MIRQRLVKDFAAKLKTILRFEGQDMNWGLAEWERFSNAWAYGLRELHVDSKHRVVSWLDENHTAELATVLLGNLKLGIRTVPLTSLIKKNQTSFDDIPKLIAQEKADVFIYSPNQLIDTIPKDDLVQRIPPESRPKLMVQTGFYSKPYGLRFKDVLLFRDRRFSNLEELNNDTFLKTLGDVPFLKFKENDIIFFTGPFENYKLVSRALLCAAAQDGAFINFVPIKKLITPNGNLADTIADETKIHFIATSSDKSSLENSLKRKNNEFHYFD